MAKQGDRIAILKLGGIVFVVGVLLYYLLKWIF